MRRSAAAAAILIAAIAPAAAGQGSEVVMHSFAGGADGANPAGALVLGANGAFYGLTTNGGGASACGTSGCGTAYEITGSGNAWSETVIYAFQGNSDGATPFDASLTAAQNGTLYGATLFGGTDGDGTVFQLQSSNGGNGPWTETVIYSFTGESGDNPHTTLLLAGDGTLYGTTYAGGGTGCGGSGCGTVFSLTPPAPPAKHWKFKTLHMFHGHDGATPIGGLVAGAGGVLYGTTSNGGNKACGGIGCGTVFSLTPPVGGTSWKEAVLHAFAKKPNGEIPFNSLLLDSSGNLYGSTANGGGANCNVKPILGCGADFELSPPAGGTGPWTETALKTFDGRYDGAYPQGALIAGAGGALYGATYGGGEACPVCAGTVYELTPPGGGVTAWTETVLYAFKGGTDPIGPDGGVIAGPGGALYGTTSLGGATNLGAAYAITP